MKELKELRAKKSKNFKKNIVFYLTLASLFVAITGLVVYITGTDTQGTLIRVGSVWFQTACGYLIISHR